jgi:hypothetical protein
MDRGSLFPDLWTMTPAGADLEPLLDLAGASTLPDQQPVAP